MDLGARVAWPNRHNPDELSAIQHAMNLRLRNEAAFWAEYQNEPLADETGVGDELTADQIADKLNRLTHGTVPISATRLTAFIDVQATLLYYVVCAWEDDFTGYVVDYGVYPDQQRAYFTLRDAQLTLAMVTQAGGLEGQIYAGLEALTRSLLDRSWIRGDGAAMCIERCLIDANWGQSTDVVYEFCRQSAHTAIVMPSHGKFVGASSRALTDRAKKPGERIGWHWYIPLANAKRGIRHVLYDTNFWKSFIHTRLAVAMGDRGCLSLFGNTPERHRLFADHLCAEYRVNVEARGRSVDEWKMRAERGDNHWFDGLVGCAVGASMQGSNLDNVGPVAQPKTRPVVSFAEQRRNAKKRHEQMRRNRS